jgi:hypothetical protein
MPSRYSLFAGAATLAMSAPLLLAQYTISAHSGLIQYTSGAVTAGGQPVKKMTTNVLSLKNGDVLATGADGAAEVLMTPGVFVRMVGNSSLRMDSISLADTRVTVLTGSVMVECAELIKGDNVTFFVSSVDGSPSVELRKKSLFRIDAQPAQVAVLQGEVFAGGATVSKDKELELGAVAVQPMKFKLNKQEDLYMFSEARSADSAYASNVVSQSLYSAGGTCLGSSWYYMNPVSMYAYLPCNGFAGMFGYPFFGVNYGYMYGGIPYYYAPPGIVANTPPAPAKPLPAQPKAPVTTSERAVQAASSNGLMKVPAFVSVLNTKPTYMTVSRASYLANIPGGEPSSSASNSHLAGPALSSNRTTTNRYMAATSLSSAPSVSGHGGGGVRAGTSYGGSSGGGHYAGGSSVSPSYSHGSSASYSAGSSSMSSGRASGGSVSASVSSAGGHK